MDRINLVKSISKAMKLIEEKEMTFHLCHSKQYFTLELRSEYQLFLMKQLWIYMLKTVSADERAKSEMLDHYKAHY